MRKLFVLFLISTLAINIGGYLYFFHQRRQAARRTMLSRIRAGRNMDQLEEFEFPLREGRIQQAGFSWEEDHEFLFNGKMYDVVEQRVEGNKVRIRCIEDSREKMLLDELLALQARQQHSSKFKTSLLQFLSTLYCHGWKSICPVVVPVRQTGDSPYSYHWRSIVLDRPTPPPRC